MPLLLSIVVHRNSGHPTVLHGRSHIIPYHPRTVLHTFPQMRPRRLDAPLTLHLCSSVTLAMCPRLHCLYLYSPLEGSPYLRSNPKPRHLNRLRLADTRSTRLTRSLLFQRKQMLSLPENPVTCQLSCAQVDDQLLQRGIIEPPPMKS